MRTKSEVVHKWADLQHNHCLPRTKSELARKRAERLYNPCPARGGGGCRTLHRPLHVRPTG